jgi:hypothetical protein
MFFQNKAWICSLLTSIALGKSVFCSREDGLDKDTIKELLNIHLKALFETIFKVHKKACHGVRKYRREYRLDKLFAAVICGDNKDIMEHLDPGIPGIYCKLIHSEDSKGSEGSEEIKGDEATKGMKAFEESQAIKNSKTIEDNEVSEDNEGGEDIEGGEAIKGSQVIDVLKDLVTNQYLRLEPIKILIDVGSLYLKSKMKPKDFGDYNELTITIGNIKLKKEIPAQLEKVYEEYNPHKWDISTIIPSLNLDWLKEYYKYTIEDE